MIDNFAITMRRLGIITERKDANGYVYEHLHISKLAEHPIGMARLRKIVDDVKAFKEAVK